MLIFFSPFVVKYSYIVKKISYINILVILSLNSKLSQFKITYFFILQQQKNCAMNLNFQIPFNSCKFFIEYNFQFLYLRILRNSIYSLYFWFVYLLFNRFGIVLTIKKEINETICDFSYLSLNKQTSIYYKHLKQNGLLTDI